MILVFIHDFQHASAAASTPRRCAARGVDERIELVEEGVAHVDDVAFPELDNAVAVGVSARNVVTTSSSPFKWN